jgi:phage-related protein
MAEQAYAYVTLIPVAKGFKKSIESELGGAGLGGNAGLDAGKSFKGGFGRAVKGFAGPLIAGLATVGVANFAKSAVAAASSFEAEFEGVNQVFGASAAKVQAFAKTAATSVGLAQAEALQAAKGFGVFATSAGLAGDSSASFATGLVQAAGDMASFNDVPVADTLAAIKSGLMGQGEPLARYGILMNEATLKQQALKEGIISNTTAALTPQQKVLSAHSLIMEKLGVQTGDFAKYQDTYGNSIKTVTALFKDMQAQVGAALLPVLAKLMASLTPVVEKLTPLMVKIFEALAPIITTVADNLGPLIDALTPLFDVFTLVAGVAAEILRQILPPLIKIIEILAPVILAVAEAIMPLVLKLMPPLVSLFEALIPIIELVADIFITAILPVLVHLVNLLADDLIDLINLLTSGFEWLASILGPVWQLLKPLVEGLFGIAGIKPSSLKKTISVTTQTSGTSIRAIESGALTSGLPTSFTLPNTTTTTGAKGESLASKIKKATTDARKDIADARKTYDKAIATANNTFNERKADIEKSYQKSVTESTTKRDKALADALKSHTTAMADIQKDFAGRLNDIVVQSMGRLRDAYRGAVETNIGDVFKMDSVGGSVTKMVQSLRDKLNASKNLLANSAKLASEGFSQTFIEQVVGAGTTTGNEMADAILKSTPETQAELKDLFRAIEVQAETGMDALSREIYEKTGLATDGLKALYAETQEQLIEAIEAQEALYAETQATIMEEFSTALAEAKIARDEALVEAQVDLEKALADAQLAFDEDLKKIQDAFKEKLRSMGADVKAMTSAVNGLNRAVDAAKGRAVTAISTYSGGRGAQVALATGGLVTGPTNALVGEAGPEVVIPLDRFERMMDMNGSGQGKTLNYYAAPNQSIDSEEALALAMRRTKVVATW